MRGGVGVCAGLCVWNDCCDRATQQQRSHTNKQTYSASASELRTAAHLESAFGLVVVAAGRRDVAHDGRARIPTKRVLKADRGHTCAHKPTHTARPRERVIEDSGAMKHSSGWWPTEESDGMARLASMCEDGWVHVGTCECTEGAGCEGRGGEGRDGETGSRRREEVRGRRWGQA
jgi:hypothetical protein